MGPYTALKYHPDRNPGREAEFISKFQTIQCANEVLTDPTQRAKYDADRIRSGLFYPYASSTRPNVPPRSPATNFPPPPTRSQPPSATKATHPVPPTGPNRYTQYSKQETPDDNHTKANAFKAWEQMRHGTGPPPTSRVPPRATKPPIPTRPVPNGVGDDNTPPRRTAYDQFQETQSASRMSRANTTRVPKKTAFATGTFAADETPAPTKAPLNNVHRSERPPRATPSFAMPPPPGHRKAESFGAFKPYAGSDVHMNNSDRISTPYATAGGERTYFSSHGLGRPTSSERRGSAERYDTDPQSRDTSHGRVPSTPTERQHHSASPKMRTPQRQVPVSSSSSSTSSSDEGQRFAGRPFGTRRKPLRKPAEAQRRPNLKPTVRVDTAPDAGAGHAAPYNRWADGKVNQQVPEHPSKPDQPEGFLQHRLKRDSLRMDPGQRRGSATHVPASTAQTQHPLHRPKSWHENYGPAKNDQNMKSESRPLKEGQADKEPMYENPRYSPSPSTPKRKWSDQWPFTSSKTSGKSSERPPYWAIPSSLPPLRQSRSQEASEEHENPTSTSNFANRTSSDDADLTPKSSFKFPSYDAKKPFDGKPPLRSHSSESISTNFSPSHWNGKFTSGNEYIAPPTSSRSDFPNGRVNAKTAQAMPPPPRQDGTQISSSAPTTALPPHSAQGPPPPNPITRSKEEWTQYFKPQTFAYPPPKSSSPVRGTSRKRAKTPRKVPIKRPQPASVANAVDDATIDTEAPSVESLSSRTSGDESAMDIDSVITPTPVHSNAEHKSSAKSDRTVTGERPTPRAPPIPPRVNGRSTGPPEPIYVSDLKNVAPFAPNEKGLQGLGDLTSTLPFESRPSGKPPVVIKPQLLELPHPPKAPAPPPQNPWLRYIAQMKAYMLEWNEYNSKMLAHFTERQSNIGNTLTGDWMSSQGSQGYLQYMQGVEEDFRVREHWDVSWEKHRECMKILGSVRSSHASSS